MNGYRLIYLLAKESGYSHLVYWYSRNWKFLDERVDEIPESWQGVMKDGGLIVQVDGRFFKNLIERMIVADHIGIEDCKEWMMRMSEKQRVSVILEGLNAICETEKWG